MQDHSSKKDSVEWQQVIDREWLWQFVRVKQIAYKNGFVYTHRTESMKFVELQRAFARELNSRRCESWSIWFVASPSNECEIDIDFDLVIADWNCVRTIGRSDALRYFQLQILATLEKFLTLFLTDEKAGLLYRAV